jgi:light-regulated signal transduction histidine kinase (bacteriophytochrome)
MINTHPSYIKKDIDDKAQRLKNDMELFNYILSHDLKKPLRVLLNSCNEMRDNYSEKIDSNYKEFLDSVGSTVNDMQIMLDAILEYIRLEIFPPELRAINLGEIFNQIVEQRSNDIKKINATLTYNELPTILGYSKHIKYLFSQLLDNSIKFRKIDQPLEVLINFELIEGFYKFTFSDNGISIEEEFFEVVFLLFQRLHTQEEIPGYGIGLALCKKIVESCGGTMWVEVENLSGCNFIFTLPFVNNTETL